MVCCSKVEGGFGLGNVIARILLLWVNSYGDSKGNMILFGSHFYMPLISIFSLFL